MNHPNERVDMTCAILRVANFAFYSLLQVVNIIMIVGIIRIVMCCHLHLLVALSSSPILLTQTQIIVCIGKYVYCISLWSEEWCLLSPTSSKHYCDHHHCCRYRNCCHRHYFRVSPSSSSFLFTHTCRPHHFCFVFFFFLIGTIFVKHRHKLLWALVSMFVGFLYDLKNDAFYSFK